MSGFRDDAFRIRLNLIVLLLLVCASFLGAIAVGVTGGEALGTAMLFLAVFAGLCLLVEEWKPGVEDELKPADGANAEESESEWRELILNRRTEKNVESPLSSGQPSMPPNESPLSM
ncbi:hypothetical protein [Haladaptatus sp. W1]|uniref:hypothetical protein n=1 Tax=Haladaptatus sp. W1 TaxID=1897478 RepID=UPI0020C767FE|nr:hypothetical protein [Haladaptatus sp. W1]